MCSGFICICPHLHIFDPLFCISAHLCVTEWKSAGADGLSKDGKECDGGQWGCSALFHHNPIVKRWELMWAPGEPGLVSTEGAHPYSLLYHRNTPLPSKVGWENLHPLMPLKTIVCFRDQCVLIHFSVKRICCYTLKVTKLLFLAINC